MIVVSHIRSQTSFIDFFAYYTYTSVNLICIAPKHLQHLAPLLGSTYEQPHGVAVVTYLVSQGRQCLPSDEFIHYIGATLQGSLSSAGLKYYQAGYPYSHYAFYVLLLPVQCQLILLELMLGILLLPLLSMILLVLLPLLHKGGRD